MQFEVTHFTINKKKWDYAHIGTRSPISQKNEHKEDLVNIVICHGCCFPHTCTPSHNSTPAKLLAVIH